MKKPELEKQYKIAVKALAQWESLLATGCVRDELCKACRGLGYESAFNEACSTTHSAFGITLDLGNVVPVPDATKKVQS